MNVHSAILASLVSGIAWASNAYALDLLVSSTDNDRVLRYNGLTGELIDVFARGGGLDLPLGMVCHTDGKLYVGGFSSDQVHRFDSSTGDFIDVFASGGGLDQTEDLIFGPDGNLYVSSFANDRVLRYDGQSGEFIDNFASGGGLDGPAGLDFGADGNLYVASFNGNEVLRYDGATGAFMDVFASGGGLNGAEGVLFGPDGHLYVASFSSDRVLRYNGSTGAFMDVFASGGGLDAPVGMTFGLDGHFYVAGWNSNQVLRYDGATGAFIDVFASGGGLDVPAYPVFCNTSGVRINAGITDAWFNNDTPGQGFFIVVFPDQGIVFLAWFTYDTERPPQDVVALLGEPGHRWVTAQGPFNGDTAILTVFLTSGGVFDSAEPPAMTDVDNPLGTITIVWHDCTSATLTYDIDPPGVTGEIALRRIVPDNEALCEALAAQ